MPAITNASAAYYSLNAHLKHIFFCILWTLNSVFIPRAFYSISLFFFKYNLVWFFKTRGFFMHFILFVKFPGLALVKKLNGKYKNIAPQSNKSRGKNYPIKKPLINRVFQYIFTRHSKSARNRLKIFLIWTFKPDFIKPWSHTQWTITLF